MSISALLSTQNRLNLNFHNYIMFQSLFTGNMNQSEVNFIYVMLYRERIRHRRDFSRHFLVGTSQQHKEILIQMGLDNFCVEPYFTSLTHNMRELVEVLAVVAAGVPQQHYGFYRSETHS